MCCVEKNCENVSVDGDRRNKVLLLLQLSSQYKRFSFNFFKFIMVNNEFENHLTQYFSSITCYVLQRFNINLC